MAKNFGKAGIAKKIKEVEKLSAEKAQIITLQMINTENLLDYPRNGEDIEDTADIENSIREIGFTDPIEVTGYGMPDGKYMIVSGHRRRAAGVKTGMELFPCLVRSFNSDEEVRNYVLLSNSQRDTAKDPLLFVKRYKMHEEYLKESGYNGSIREEVAKRLGISVQQADRYKQFNKIILPVWDMVRNEEIGMSSVLPMATHTPEEQTEIYNIIVECILSMEDGEKPNRKTVKMIIDKYRDGAKSWDDIADDIKVSNELNKNAHGEENRNREAVDMHGYEEHIEGQTTIDDFTGPQLYDDSDVKVEDNGYETSPYEDDSLPAFDVSSGDCKSYEIDDLRKDFIKNIDGMKKIIEKYKKNPELKGVHVGNETLEDAIKARIGAYFDGIQELIELLDEV